MSRSIVSAWAAAFVLACFVPPALAQKLNPDLSVIGDVRAQAVDTDGESTHSLELHEVEVGLAGALNPYASAVVYLGIHGTEGIEVEEAKLTLDRYLPASLALTAGQSLLDFGQINPRHRHAFPWLDAPLMHQEFFGEDGARDVTARLDWLAPTTGPAIRASAGVLGGTSLLGGHDHAAADSIDAEEDAPELGASGRLELFAQPSGSVSFAIGGSVLHGAYDPADGAHATWLDIDAKFNFDLGPTRKLVLQVEGVKGTLEASEETSAQDPTGFFAVADLRLDRRWNVGGWAESTAERADDSIRTSRYGGFVGLQLMEETTVFRAVARRTSPDEAPASNELVLQALFSLGPHQPHRF
ncbi:MAG: hypothetical protein KC591_16635 [Gemmatimonadetes bacterium]|nr:hypothetical protein [Gemmatimonadota bacterium]